MSILNGGGWAAGAALGCALLGFGCASESGDGEGSGSTTCTSGTSCTPGSIGAPTPGGSVSGNAMGTGGSSTTAGGPSAGSGGAPGVPNTGSGGASAGTGGSDPSTGGSGGASSGTGGSAPGTGGSPTEQPPIEMPPPAGSDGCGASDWPESGTFMIDVAGTAREYVVTIPGDYDPNTPYKLVFAWHGLGGTAAQIAGGFGGGYYGLQNRAAGSTIFVAGQGLQTSSSVGSGPGWPNTGGRDVAFVRALLAWMQGSYCIDDNRIFSVGMSYGGIMSNTLGCQMGDVFRAIAPMAGSGPNSFGGGTCVGQVAAWLSHGNTDTIVSFASGQNSRDHWVESNHCEATTAPVTPDPCVTYSGCDDGHPVHWCEFDGGHTIPPFASEAIWSFFSQF